jgi:hypothetical protein
MDGSIASPHRQRTTLMRFRLALFACLALLAPAARAADLDPHLPPDTQRYMSIDVKQIVSSPVGKKLGTDRLAELLPYLPETSEVLKQIDVDALKDVDRIQLSAPGSGEADKGLMILTGRFDQAKLKKKAEDRDAFEVIEVKLDDKQTHVVYKAKKAGKGQYLAVVENKTLLASGGKEYVVAALKQARSGKKVVLKDKEVQAVLEKADPKLGISVAVRGGSLPKNDLLALVPKIIRNAAAKLGVIGGGAAFTNEVKFELSGAAKSDDGAQSVRDVTGKGINLVKVGLGFLGNENKMVNLVREILDTTKVGGKGKVVTFSARLTADVLDDFTKD